MRGLKYVIRSLSIIPTCVASHADAWIEITGYKQSVDKIKVASHADAWIEIASWSVLINVVTSRIPRGCVD